MAFVHLNEFPVMFGELCAKRFDWHFAAERLRRIFLVSPRKIPENHKKKSLE
jgi:hypothetical protein